MQRRCKCGHYRFRTVNSEYIKCRKCGTLKLKEFAAERQIAQYNSEIELEKQQFIISFAS